LTIREKAKGKREWYNRSTQKLMGRKAAGGLVSSPGSGRRNYLKEERGTLATGKDFRRKKSRLRKARKIVSGHGAGQQKRRRGGI